MTTRTEDQIKAERLHVALFNKEHVTNFVHWDRSPWGVRIPLTHDQGEFAPSLYVMTELQRFGPGDAGFRWFGQLGNFDTTEGAAFEASALETSFEWVERVWLGETEESVAHDVATFVRLLMWGTLPRR